MSALFDIFAIPFGWLMRAIYNVVGNYGVTLLIFTLITKIILTPLAVKQKKSTIKMNIFNPMIQNIQKKYANDQRKMQAEMQKLQQDYGFSMASGCGPMVAQLPILFALINVIYKPLKYIVGVNKAVVDEITPIAEGIVGSLSRYSPQTDIIAAIKQNPAAFTKFLDADKIAFAQKMNFTFMGMDLTQTPSLKVFNLLILIPIVSVVLMMVQQVMTMKLNGQKMEGSMKFMPFYTSAMFLYFGFIMPAGVSMYWIYNSLFGVIQEYILSKFIDPEKEKRKIEREIAEKRKRLKEAEKHRPAKAKQVIREDKKKAVEENSDARLSDDAKARLERARAMDKEKYGD